MEESYITCLILENFNYDQIFVYGSIYKSNINKKSNINILL